MSPKNTRRDANLDDLSLKGALEKANKADLHEKGLRAMGNYSTKVAASVASKLSGSADLDSGYKNAEPNGNRWDYVIDYDGKLFYIEVHAANTSNVKEVMSKFDWLKSKLKAGGELFPLSECTNGGFHWIATNGVDISSNSPQARRLAISGIQGPKMRLDLD